MRSGIEDAIVTGKMHWRCLKRRRTKCSNLINDDLRIRGWEEEFADAWFRVFY